MKSPLILPRHRSLIFPILLFSVSFALAQELVADWPSRLRALVGTGQIGLAMQACDEWIKAYPEDIDARAWHARLQAWMHHWQEAEAEYKELLRKTPEDVDLLAGLADVLMWQKRHQESLNLLERACRLAPQRTDCQLQRARVLEKLGREREARLAYRRILDQDGQSVEAQAALTHLRDGARHEFRVGTDVDLLNYAENAGAIGAAFRSRLNQRWSSQATLAQYRRFGEYAVRAGGEATVRLSGNDSVSFGGAASRDRGVIPRSEAQFEYGHGFRIRGNGAIRGVETSYQQRWLWYRDARLLVLSPGAILYLPRDWSWLFRVSAARTHFASSPVEWKPAGWTRLSFPVARQVSGHLLFAAGTENFGLVDQIRQFSSRTWGAGLRFSVAPGQEFISFGSYQSRSEGRAQTSFGVSYAIRF